MLGFHADGIRLFGASDTLVAALKKHKLPLVKTSTTNTLVFASKYGRAFNEKALSALFSGTTGTLVQLLCRRCRTSGGVFSAFCSRGGFGGFHFVHVLLRTGLSAFRL